MPVSVSMRAARVWLLSIACYAFCPHSLAAQTLPPPWFARDVGHPVLAGWSGFSSGVFELDGAGLDVWGTSDQFRFVYQAVRGDVDMVARVDSLTPADRWSKVGLMVRSSLGAGASHGYVLVSAGMGVAFQRRPRTDGLTFSTPGADVAAPCWLRLVRSGTTVTAYSSADGTEWRLVGQDRVTLGETAYVGLAVASHSESMRASAVVSHVAIRLTALPEPLNSVDIGSPAVAGNAFADAGTLVVNGAGADIWGVSDQFHYVYRPVRGDIDVSVRVRSLLATDPWAKVGVMLRESLTPGARHATALLSAAHGYAFQRRAETGGSTDHTSGNNDGASGWLRLVRSGSRIEAFYSADGRAWLPMGADFISMSDAVYVGVAVTSHNVGAATTAIVDQFQVSAAPPTPAPSSPIGIAFQASKDHAVLVQTYRLKVFVAGSLSTGGTLAASRNLGKPVPDAAGEISVDVSDLFSALAPGIYEVVVDAVGSAGARSSAPVEFIR